MVSSLKAGNIEVLSSKVKVRLNSILSCNWNMQQLAWIAILHSTESVSWRKADRRTTKSMSVKRKEI